MPPHTFALRVACATKYNRPTSKLQWGCLRSSNIGASQHVKRLRRRPFDGLADVALYNEDIDQPGVVAAADRLRAEVQSADALLLVTPEYNGTMSAALKNATKTSCTRSSALASGPRLARTTPRTKGA